MERKARPYEALRTLMWRLHVTYKEIVSSWNAKTGAKMTEPYMSELMNGKRRFHVDFAYFILDTLGVPHTQFSEYFPDGGYAE